MMTLQRMKILQVMMRKALKTSNPLTKNKALMIAKAQRL